MDLNSFEGRKDGYTFGAFLGMAGASVRALAFRRRKRVHAAVEPLAQTAPVRLTPDDVSVEAIYQATVGAGAVIVAIIGVRSGVGVSVVARALAERSLLSRRRTLLVDATGRAAASADATLHERHALHHLKLNPSDEELYSYRSTPMLRALWEEERSRFDVVVVDCSPALDAGASRIPGPLAARSAEATILVGLAGRETREAVAAARAALGDARVAGVVVNGRDQPTVGVEAAREALRISRRFPKISRKLAERALHSRWLDVPA